MMFEFVIHLLILVLVFSVPHWLFHLLQLETQFLNLIFEFQQVLIVRVNHGWVVIWLFNEVSVKYILLHFNYVVVCRRVFIRVRISQPNGGLGRAHPTNKNQKVHTGHLRRLPMDVLHRSPVQDHLHLRHLTNTIQTHHHRTSRQPHLNRLHTLLVQQVLIHPLCRSHS